MEVCVTPLNIPTAPEGRGIEIKGWKTQEIK